MRRFSVTVLFALSAVLLAFSSVNAAGAAGNDSKPAHDAILVLDASGSMWARMNGKPQIVVAKDVILNLLDDLSANYRLGLMAYGHRRKGDCSDIQMLVPVGGGRDAIRQAIKGISPKGKTPMTQAVIDAAEKLKYTENQATVILVSDGKESCGMDPCAAAKRLEQLGVDLTVHAIGFGMEKGSKGLKQVQCFANYTGGQFFAANNAEQLTQALAQVSQAVSKESPEITLTVPERVKAGASFEVSWSAVVNGDDRIVLVPADAKANTSDNGLRVGDKRKGQLTAPADPRTYSVRYVSADNGQVLARAPLQVITKVDISAPEQVTAGAVFEVTWSKIINPGDSYTIVPAGADEGVRKEWHLVGDGHKGHLTAPTRPGMYEVRYVLDNSYVTMASTRVEVVEAKTSISAPKQVTAGSVFEVTWTNTINTEDFYTIVPAGADEGVRKEWHLVGDGHEGHLTAPAQPGLYEVRYVLNKDGSTLASTPVEVVKASTDISAPKKVTAGTVFEVTWTNIINTGDFYTIVPAGADEGVRKEWHLVGDSHVGHLTAPAQPGLYEVRYVLNQGNVTLASTRIEVTEADTSISAPEKVRAGTVFTVTWAKVINPGDWYTIVPAGSPEGTFGEDHQVGEGHEGRLTAPAQPGLYEVRYVLDQGNVTLASQTVEVVPKDASLSSGASLNVPSQAAPGDTITVTWAGGSDSDGQRVALARADASDFTWIEVHPVNADKSLQFTLPKDPGRYEVRYLDVGNMEVLARAIVHVK